jgi:hypothetical protein
MVVKTTKTKPVAVARSRDASVRSRVRVGSGDASKRRAGTRDRTAAKRDGQARASRDASKPGVSKSRRASKNSARPRSPARVGFVCPPCGRFVTTEVDGVVLRPGRGSPPRFCSPSCRQAAYRRRRAGVAEDIALQPGGGRDRSLKQMKTTRERSGRKRNA